MLKSIMRCSLKGKTVVERLIKHIGRSQPGLSLGWNQEFVFLSIIFTLPNTLMGTAGKEHTMTVFQARWRDHLLIKKY